MVFTEAQTLGRCRQPCSAMVHADAGLGSTGMPSSSGYPNDRLRFCGRPPCHAPCPKHVLGRRYARRGEHMDAASPRTCSACVAAPLSRLSRVQTTTACLPSADVVKPAWHVGRNVGRARWVSAFSRAWLCRDTSQERTANGDVVLVAVVLHDGDVVADAHERLVLVGLLEDLEEVSGRRRPAAARPCRARVLRKRLKKIMWVDPAGAHAYLASGTATVRVMPWKNGATCGMKRTWCCSWYDTSLRRGPAHSKNRAPARQDALLRRREMLASRTARACGRRGCTAPGCP